MARWYFGRAASADWIAVIDRGGSWQTHGFAAVSHTPSPWVAARLDANGPHSHP